MELHAGCANFHFEVDGNAGEVALVGMITHELGYNALFRASENSSNSANNIVIEL
jgi:hypothetical protein